MELSLLYLKFNKRDPLQLCNLPKKTVHRVNAKQNIEKLKSIKKKKISSRMKKETTILFWNFRAWIIACQAEIS